MNSGTLFEPQEIILTEISFPDQQPKKRPVLIISKFSKNDSENIFVCLPITSCLSDEAFAIEIMDSDMQVGHLLKRSQVLCQYYFTDSKSNVSKKIGKITPQFYQTIKTKIREDVLDV